MNLNEKILHLRKSNNLTQEQLAEQLYVSRTAVSKWESGKGYPNIESLKGLSKIFGVSIDELLSNEELLTIAEKENRANLRCLSNLIYGILDIMTLAFLFLPFYGQSQGDHIQGVNLFSYDPGNPILRTVYFGSLLLLTAIGITELFLRRAEPKKTRRSNNISLSIHAAMILLFALSRQPYVTAFLFLLFLIKGVLLRKEKTFNQ